MPFVIEARLTNLSIRQAGGATAINNAATLNALQYPSITTHWAQTTLADGQVTYAPVVYTQTFAAVPDQWASPIAGAIGYGTLSKSKRDIAPEPTSNTHGIAGRIHR